MQKTRPKNVQTAQGMLEFALVLPILLLLILGVFAFGHLFFAYSSVVSASREAARWGSAVGVTESARPRFRDCAAIRAQAVRVGAFAGVAAVDGPDDANTPGIYVGFDHGPTIPEPDFDDCSDDAGPTDIGYGDRIIVRVTVQYNPIVPVVNIPSFPLSATTARTLVKSLPVGDSPLSEPSCKSTVIVMELLPIPIPAILPASPVVGQQVDVRVKVTASDGSDPNGTVFIYDELGHTCPDPVVAGSMVWQYCTLVPSLEDDDDGYSEVGEHFVSARYTPDNTGGGTCYRESELLDEPLDVIKADTVVTITSDDPDPSYSGEPVLVTFTVAADNPGAGTPTGMVTVSDQSGHTCSAVINMLNGSGECTIYPTTNTHIIGVYGGDNNFNPSPPSAPEEHRIITDATETPTPIETPDGQPTVTATPTKTATPLTCPSLAGTVDFTVQNGLQFLISNAGGPNTNIERLNVTWPVYPDANLREIHFGPLNTLDQCITKGGGENCLYRYPQQLEGWPPPSVTLSPSTATWDKQADTLPAGQDKYMRMLFTDVLPPGDYMIIIDFKGGCRMEIPAIR